MSKHIYKHNFKSWIPPFSLIWIPFLSYVVDDTDLKLLQKMDAKGYKLVEYDYFKGWKFEPAQGESYIYTYDFNSAKPKDGLVYYKNEEEFDEYIEIFKSGGWEYVCTPETNIHIFRAQKGTLPIYTESEGMADNCKRIYKKSLGHCLFFLVGIIGTLALAVFIHWAIMLFAAVPAAGLALFAARAWKSYRKR